MSCTSSSTSIRVEGHRLEFVDGGVLEIRFRQKYRKYCHSFEDQTMEIVEDQVVGSPSFYRLPIPTEALTSPRLVKLHLLRIAVIYQIIIHAPETLDVVARGVASRANMLLMTGPNSYHSSGLRLFAQVEVITHHVVHHLGVEVEVEEESTVPSRGASENAVMKLKREEGFEGDGACVICLDGLSAATKVVTGMPCNHVFHTSCIFQWLEKIDTCPICRRQLADV